MLEERGAGGEEEMHLIILISNEALTIVAARIAHTRTDTHTTRCVGLRLYGLTCQITRVGWCNMILEALSSGFQGLELRAI